MFQRIAVSTRFSGGVTTCRAELPLAGNGQKVLRDFLLSLHGGGISGARRVLKEKKCRRDRYSGEGFRTIEEEWLLESSDSTQRWGGH